MDCNLSRFFYCEIELESLNIQVMSKWGTWRGAGCAGASLQGACNAKDFPTVPNNL